MLDYSAARETKAGMVFSPLLVDPSREQGGQECVCRLTGCKEDDTVSRGEVEGNLSTVNEAGHRAQAFSVQRLWYAV